MISLNARAYRKLYVEISRIVASLDTHAATPEIDEAATRAVLAIIGQPLRGEPCPARADSGWPACSRDFDHLGEHDFSVARVTPELDQPAPTAVVVARRQATYARDWN
jgi:hypothetical protein